MTTEEKLALATGKLTEIHNTVSKLMKDNPSLKMFARKTWDQVQDAVDDVEEMLDVLKAP